MVCVVLRLLEVVVKVVGVVKVHPPLTGLLYTPYCSEQLRAYFVEQIPG